LKISSLGVVVHKTVSVCPVCLENIGASVVLRSDEYFFKKKCPEHGAFSTVVWRGKSPSYEQWGAGYTPRDVKSDCPRGCGLCSRHLQKTCCALVEVTRRCNLSCPICFAESISGHFASGSGKAAHSAHFGQLRDSGRNSTSKLGVQSSLNLPPDLSGGDAELPVGELFEIFKSLAAKGNTFVQLSGGEPTVRDDLPEIIAAARAAGCENIQLNSNGIRLGSEPLYTKKLKDAGLSFVFMQFDGTRDDAYLKLRGEALLDVKCAAIDICGENLIGVTLVPTVVPGVNDDNIGDIIKFGLERSPAVRGVHFQPVSYFGRYPHEPSNEDRITLPEILRAIEVQTNRKFSMSDFVPSACDHPRCGFHGDFVVLPGSRVMKLTKRASSSCCDDDDAHLKNRKFVARRWKRAEDVGKAVGKDADFQDMDTFLSRVKSHGFTITAMAFQDAYNLDLERLRRCSLHVAQGGRLIPFCANYLD